jgi:TPR repeat protein
MLAATLPGTAFAATSADIEALLKERRFFAATQQATELIEQGGLSGPALGRVYLLRGQALNERLRSRDAEADFLRARELFPKNSSASSEGAYWLGRVYARNGREKQEALTLLREAARAGLAEADYEIGLLYGEESDNQEAMRALQRASRKGVVRAITAIARLNSYGASRTQNPAEAARLFRLAAQRGDPEAQYQLALAYRDGYGVTKDLAVSRSWQDKALAQGHAGAHLVQGDLFDGTGDALMAQYHYWHAAQGGSAAGMINLGLAYLRGRGVEQDWQQAARWLSRAQGVPMADFLLGGMSLYGVGMERNDQVAFEAYQRAANVMPEAKAMLAGLYQGGIGVPRDVTRAQRLLDEVLALDDAASISNAAWMLATSERAEVRQPALARRLAERSMQLDSSGYAQILAAAFAAGGDFNLAIEAQQRVVADSTESSRALQEQRLARYRAYELWIEPFQARQEPSTTPSEPQVKPVATFVGEVVQLGPTSAGRRPAGYELGAESAFVMRVLVEKVEGGALPHFMEESAVFYLVNPVQLFAGLPQDTPAFEPPVGPQRFVLTEVAGNGWSFDLQVAPLESQLASPVSLQQTP